VMTSDGFDMLNVGGIKRRSKVKFLYEQFE
jgi:hypothetical protein